MSRMAAVLCIFWLVAATVAQNPLAPAKEPPQTARQALLETFFGETPNHLERHLPELAKKAFRQLDSGTGTPNFITQIGSIGMQAKHGSANFQTMETGPILLVAEEHGARQKFEVVVEHDELIGDANEIELSFHLYKNGREEGLPVVPRLTFSLKTEANVWRIYDISLSARAPIGDPDFLKTLVKHLERNQQGSNETWAQMSLRSIAGAEANYLTTSPNHAYTCSLSQLAQATKPKEGEYPAAIVDEQLATGKKNGYIFALTGCDALHFKAAAEPATPGAGRNAFCVDESGTIKFSPDRKATTCLSRGQQYGGPGSVTVPDTPED
jgi:hypothetical protein